MTDTAYFDRTSAALRDADIDAPVMVVDLDRLDRNIETVAGMVQPGMALRLVAKSLPSQPLLDYVADHMSLSGQMVFSPAMLAALLAALVEREAADDLLLGKPFPQAATAQILKQFGKAAATRVQWLADSAARVQALGELGAQTGLDLRISLEIDVGLHRGGFATGADLDAALDLIAAHSNLHLSGLMGYEAHLAKMPGPLRRRADRQARNRYAAAVEQTRARGLWSPDLCLNTGGSLTFSRYGPGDAANEVSVGSALLLPSDFDGPDNAALDCAFFVATPILKHLPRNPQPGLEFLRRNQLVIMGGYWMADPVHPAGFRPSRIFGHSSNQEVWDGRSEATVDPDGFAFLRPHQSEAIISYLGRIVAMRGKKIEGIWPVYPSV